MIGNRFNYDNIFFRDLTVCVLDTLEGKIGWTNKFSSGDKEIKVPFYYSMSGGTRFLLDSFADDIVSNNRQTELNTDVIPRGHLTLTGMNIKSDEFRNPNVWLRNVVENKTETKKMLRQLRAIPIVVNYDLSIILKSEGDIFKCTEAIMNMIWLYDFMYFEHNFMQIDAVMVIPDANQIEIPREVNMASDSTIKLTLSFEVHTYYPAFGDINKAISPSKTHWYNNIYMNSMGNKENDESDPHYLPPVPDPIICPDASTLNLPDLIGYHYNGILEIGTLDPSGHDPSRELRIDSRSGSTWSTIYEGLDDLSYPSEFSNPSIVDEIRWRYRIDQCNYGFYTSSVPSTSQCGIYPNPVNAVADASILQEIIFGNVIFSTDGEITSPPIFIISDDTGFLQGGTSSLFNNYFGYIPNFSVGDIIILPTTASTYYTELVYTPQIEDLIVNNDVSYPSPDGYYYVGPFPTSIKSKGIYIVGTFSTYVYFQLFSFTQSDFGEGTLISLNPTASLSSSHQILIEYQLDGIWIEYDTVNESVLAASYSISVFATTTKIRTTALYRNLCRTIPVEYNVIVPNIDLLLSYVRGGQFGDQAPQSSKGALSYNGGNWSTTNDEGGYLLYGQYYLGESIAGTVSLSKANQGSYMRNPTSSINRRAFVCGDRSSVGVQNSGFGLSSYYSGGYDMVIIDDYGPPPTLSIRSPYVTNLNNESISGISESFDGTSYLFSGYPNTLISYDAINYTHHAVGLTGINAGNPQIVSSVVTDPNFYVVFTRESSYWTSDGGASWSMTTGKDFGDVDIYDSIAMDVNIILVSTNEGIFRSTDGGKFWNPTSISDVVIGHNFYAMDNLGVCIGRYRSLDAGLTWDLMSAPPDAISPTSYSVVMLSKKIILYGSRQLWITYDGGDSIQLYPRQPLPYMWNPRGFYAAIIGWISNHI